MKILYLIFLSFSVLSFSTFSLAMGPDIDQCDIDNDEKLVCEVLMCNPLGLAIPESRDECIQKNIEFSIYLATLGFWESPPKCKMRDKDCSVVGNASSAVVDSSHCDNSGNDLEQEACRTAVDAVSDGEHCDRYSGENQTECLRIQELGNE